MSDVRMSAVRRCQQLLTVVQARSSQATRICLQRLSSDSKVTIGDVTIKTQAAKHPELVPRKYVPAGLNVPQSVLRHLQWIMQKDKLGQDVFLIGPPGSLRRSVAMMYAELTNREVEYVSLSRDTTETDIKQRREIHLGTAEYIDQCAVKAATEGRVLVLEGIEKAERNVLPVLNNLLENREMQLDDGRFLMAAQRYDSLLQSHSAAELSEWKLVRVNERFRVVALGLPVPRFRGNPLDPPLRSRFQARDISLLPFSEQLEELQQAGVESDVTARLLSFGTALRTDDSLSVGLPDFPLHNLGRLTGLLGQAPGLPLHSALQRLYPADVMLNTEGQKAVGTALEKFEITKEPLHLAISSVSRASGKDTAAVSVSVNHRTAELEVTSGTLGESATSGDAFVETGYHRIMLADMMLSHAVGDFCIVGPKGCGKSVLVQRFAEILGYDVEPIMLYQDMSSRDLLQQRVTLPNGDTAWRPSPLVTSAREGRLAVLDGLHRVNAGTFAVLHRLLHDRELCLFDGTRLLRRDRYDDVMQEQGWAEQDMVDRGVFPIHPSFRVIGLGEPPSLTSSGQQWLTPEMLTAFMFHSLRPLDRAEERAVIQALAPNATGLDKLLDLVGTLRESTDKTAKSLGGSLSTRQLLRIARRLAEFPAESLFDAVHKACLSRFLPRLAKATLDRSLEEAGIFAPEATAHGELTCEVKDGKLKIGQTEAAVHDPENLMKVPDVLFYENTQHMEVMEAMLRDWQLGEHLLLVGNQGVGKNKIVDHFLHLLRRPREYLQLHRDTTVQTLTLQPTVRDGRILYEDSPLVRAVKSGDVLVVDEADKAPTNVTCILKTLVESGEMYLADARRIVPPNSGHVASDKVLVMHPDFRMVVLANRPGFPFLGNDFFGAMGDVFSCHAVDNPDITSEMEMLRKYGPSVPQDTLRQLVMAFGDLRSLADQGLIAYPYSTRELVNIVKHLEEFPGDSLPSVVRNVFDFDNYNKELLDTVQETLEKHGIPVKSTGAAVKLATDFTLPGYVAGGYWAVGGIKASSSITAQNRDIEIKGPVRLGIGSSSLDKQEARASTFQELQTSWQIPVDDVNYVADIAVSRAEWRHADQSRDLIHAITANPVRLHTWSPDSTHMTVIDLSEVFPRPPGHFRQMLRLSLAPLGASADDTVILHEQTNNLVLTVNTTTGDVTRLYTSSLLENVVKNIATRFQQRASTETHYKMCGELGHVPGAPVLFYKPKTSQVTLLNVLRGSSHVLDLPHPVHDVTMTSPTQALLLGSGGQYHLLSQKDPDGLEYALQPVAQGEGASGRTQCVGGAILGPEQLVRAIGQKVSTPNRITATEDTYATLLLGFPELSDVEVYKLPRNPSGEERQEVEEDPFAADFANPVQVARSDNVCILPESGTIVRAIPTFRVPKEALPKGGAAKLQAAGYLEVVDPVERRLRYLPVPGSPWTASSGIANYVLGSSDQAVHLAALSGGKLVTADLAGCVRLWETGYTEIDESLKKWRSLFGTTPPGELQLTIERPSGKEVSSPKRGKTDEKNEPHVGGNTWAGGSGGRDTAGMGGKGGPYRLDSGNPVVQVPDWEKEEVPEHVLRAAHEMAQKAFKERLQEIQMSEYDANLYESYYSGVRKQITSLRVVLDALQAKGKERHWVKHQTQGELDEGKLIEGIAGERSIYKRRGDVDPEPGAPQVKPKRLRLLVDVSGSMYRFNGHDGRLDRQLEATLMIMEAFRGHQEKFKYDIVGHSGEDYKVELVSPDKPPSNNKHRMDVLKIMHAHSQFCLSGDYTLEATKHAITTLAKEEADEKFVICLSDANLERYGIPSRRLAEIMTLDPDVNAFVIFIGTLGDQANRLNKQLPAGHSYVCLDTKDLPKVLQQIFTSTVFAK